MRCSCVDIVSYFICRIDAVLAVCIYVTTIGGVYIYIDVSVVWRAIKKFVVTQIGEDWLFLLIIGVIMALLSFTLDYLIEKSQQGMPSIY